LLQPDASFTCPSSALSIDGGSLSKSLAEPEPTDGHTPEFGRGFSEEPQALKFASRIQKEPGTQAMSPRAKLGWQQKQGLAYWHTR
jgi:hypothetical protein